MLPSTCRQRLLPAGAAVILGTVLQGCAGYEPRPQDPRTILRDLEAVVLRLESPGGEEPGTGLGMQQAALFAVRHNPRLAALRAETGVAAAQVVEAGLLRDPVLSYDAMDVLGDLAGGETPRTPAWVSGLGVTWPVPRPGETGAREDEARSRLAAARRRVLAAEWELVRDVRLAFNKMLAIQARLELNARFLETARRTATFFERAREARAATALQANLAAVDLAQLQQARVELEARLPEARQALNTLMGLPPDATYELADPSGPWKRREPQAAGELVRRAVEHHPRLGMLMARYEAAEAVVRLEVRRQWPQISLGTGISLVLAVFTEFNKPALQTARVRRARAARDLREAVHELRAQVHAARAAWSRADAVVAGFEAEVEPRLRESVRLADRAFEAREVTLVEILTAQRQVLQGLQGALEARVRRTRARIRLEALAGLYPVPGPPDPPETRHEEEER